MPITVPCSGCQSKLNAPDNAAGKRVKCPKCAKVLTVPAAEDDFDVVKDDFDVVEDDFEVVEEIPKKAKKRVIEEDDDEEEMERPRKKGKKKPPPKNNMLLYVGLGVAALLLLAVGGYFAFSGKKSVNWVAFDPPESGMTISFPNAAPSSADFIDTMKTGETRPDSDKDKAGIEMIKAIGMKLEAWQLMDGKRRYSLGIMTIPPAVAKMVKGEDIMKGMSDSADKERGPNEKLFFSKDVTVAGQSAKQIGIGLNTAKYPNSIATFFFANGRIYILLVDREEIPDNDPAFVAFIQKVGLKTAPTPATPAGEAEKPRSIRGR